MEGTSVVLYTEDTSPLGSRCLIRWAAQVWGGGLPQVISWVTQVLGTMFVVAKSPNHQQCLILGKNVQ